MLNYIALHSNVHAKAAWSAGASPTTLRIHTLEEGPADDQGCWSKEHGHSIRGDCSIGTGIAGTQGFGRNISDAVGSEGGDYLQVLNAVLVLEWRPLVHWD